MAAATLGKALSVFGISPSVVEVFFVDHEEQVNKAKFADHLAKHGISYDTDDEYNMRMSIFSVKDKKIQEINDRESSFTVAHNHMSTLTVDEVNKMKGYVQMAGDNSSTLQLESSYIAEKNWVQEGKVNAVQNQGSCGSCWAFSSIAAMESAHAIGSGDLIKLSEQQLVDCAKTGANGCNGGNYAPAFTYAMSNKIVLESELPYTMKDGACPTLPTGQVGVTNFFNVGKSVASIKQVLSQYGPIGIAVDASNAEFQHFSSGIIDSAACGQSLDHAVTAVGYGTYEGKDYLMVRNSWGTSWGIDGYVYIALNDQNICGFMTWNPSLPKVDSSTWAS